MIQENANFSHKMTACFGDLSQFEMKIRQIAEIVQIDLRQFEIDHLAVRINSLEKAKKWREMLLENGTLLKQSDVNGRPIALITLNQRLLFCGQPISLVELPFPKNKTYPEEGWEHIEIVVPMETDERVEDWVKRCCKRWHLSENMQIKLKISEPKVQGERLPNPSIAIRLAHVSQQNFCTIKLHPYSLQQICESESNSF